MTPSKADSMTKTEKLDFYLRLPETETTPVDDHIAYLSLEQALGEAGDLYRESRDGEEAGRTPWRFRRPSRKVTIIAIAAFVTLFILIAACAWTGLLSRVLSFGKMTSINSRTYPIINSRTLPTGTQKNPESAPVPSPPKDSGIDNPDTWAKLQSEVSFPVVKPSYIPSNFMLFDIWAEPATGKNPEESITLLYRNDSTGQRLLILEGFYLSAEKGPNPDKGEWAKEIQIDGESAWLTYRNRGGFAQPSYWTYVLTFSRLVNGVLVEFVISSNTNIASFNPITFGKAAEQDTIGEDGIIEIGQALLTQ